MFKRSIALALCIVMMIFCLAACKTGDADITDSTTTADTTTVPTTTTVATTADPKLAELAQYLSTVTYNNFELTGTNEPYFMGRWFEKDISGTKHMVTVTDGSLFYFLVDGASSFNVNFTVITSLETPYFAYSIDGGAPVRQLITDKTVNLPDTGKHTVRIIADGMNSNEDKWNSEKGFALKNVTVENGSIYGIKPKDKVIFYYGDSITEGILALANSKNDPANSNTNSATNAFPWHCSEKLGAVTYSIGYSGSGITKEGSFSTFIKAIDHCSKDRLVNDGITPDVIVINHGTNDSLVNTSTREFVEALSASLTHLRAKYPDTPVFCIVPFWQSHEGDIEYVLQNFTNMYMIRTEGWGIEIVDSCHPTQVGAKTAGYALADALKEHLGEDFFK